MQYPATLLRTTDCVDSRNRVVKNPKRYATPAPGKYWRMIGNSCNDLSLTCRAVVIGVFLLSLLLLPAWGYASLYSWIDEKGVKHFSNDPPANQSVGFRTTDEFITHEKKHDPNGTESPGLPKDSDGRHIATAISKRTGSGPIVNIDFKYYDFVSVNINDIIGSMWKKSPVKYDGTSYCASTNPRIKYYLYTAQKDGTWYIDRVFTTVDVTFTMPRWDDYQIADGT